MISVSIKFQFYFFISYFSFSLTEIDFSVILPFQFLLQLTELTLVGNIQELNHVTGKQATKFGVRKMQCQADVHGKCVPINKIQRQSETIHKREKVYFPQ